MSIFDGMKKYLSSPQTVNQTPSVPSIMPIAALNCINRGVLPQLNTDLIFCEKGEIVHYIEKAILLTEKNQITGYQGGSTGWSFRVAKGVRYRTGRRQGVPIREDVTYQTKGILYITNKRILFVAKKNGFERKVDSISALMPYSNGIGIQFGNTSHSLLIPDGNVALSVINMLKP